LISLKFSDIKYRYEYRYEIFTATKIKNQYYEN